MPSDFLVSCDTSCENTSDIFGDTSCVEPVFEGTVLALDAGTRLDAFLSEALRASDVSREKIKRAIREGTCTVDGEPCLDVKKKLGVNQSIVLRMHTTPSALTPEEGALEVVYHDDHLVVVNKGPGLTVHPCPSCPEGTLVHRLLGRFPALAQQEGLRPGVVHRLDKNTSGLLVVALTEEARMRLAAAFASREVRKDYLALVHGVPPETGQCDAPLGRHPTVKVKMAVLEQGRAALSEWQVLYAHRQGDLLQAQNADSHIQGDFSLVRVRIHTGRTHQVRVHLTHEGYPLYGDTLYAPAAVAKAAPRQMLHAWRLAFTHPSTGEAMVFTCPPPVDFLTTALALRQKMQRVVVTGTPGCGKSTLVTNLAEQGVPVWSADVVVAQLYEPGKEGWIALRQRYGERFVPDDKQPVDKQALGVALQQEPDFRRNVEALIHPLVRHDMEAFWKVQELARVPFAVAEVPLWFETQWSQPSLYLKDKSEERAGSQAGATVQTLVVGVQCDKTIRHERLMTRRHWSLETVATMDGWQWPQERKMRACQLVVDNSGDVAHMTVLAGQVMEWVHGQLAQAHETFCQDWETLVAPVVKKVSLEPISFEVLHGSNEI